MFIPLSPSESATLRLLQSDPSQLSIPLSTIIRAPLPVLLNPLRSSRTWERQTAIRVASFVYEYGLLLSDSDSDASLDGNGSSSSSISGADLVGGGGGWGQMMMQQQDQQQQLQEVTLPLPPSTALLLAHSLTTAKIRGEYLSTLLAALAAAGLLHHTRHTEAFLPTTSSLPPIFTRYLTIPRHYRTLARAAWYFLPCWVFASAVVPGVAMTRAAVQSIRAPEEQALKERADVVRRNWARRQREAVERKREAQREMGMGRREVLGRRFGGGPPAPQGVGSQGPPGGGVAAQQGGNNGMGEQDAPYRDGWDPTPLATKTSMPPRSAPPPPPPPQQQQQGPSPWDDNSGLFDDASPVAPLPRQQQQQQKQYSRHSRPEAKPAAEPTTWEEIRQRAMAKEDNGTGGTRPWQ